jgi:hypothetical protein
MLAPTVCAETTVPESSAATTAIKSSLTSLLAFIGESSLKINSMRLKVAAQDGVLRRFE